MKARKHLLTHVFVSLAALPVALPPAMAANPPAIDVPHGGPVSGMEGTLRAPLSAQAVSPTAAILVAQAEEPKPADEGDPEKKKKPGAEPEPPKAEPPKAEPKPEPKPEPKAEPKPEPKPEPKAEPKPEPKAEPKPEPKAEPKPEPKAEAPKPEAPAPKAEAPKAEAPKDVAPKAEPPKVEKPKPEEPKAEAPKPDAAKPEAKPAPAEAKPEAKPAAPEAKPAPDAKPAPEGKPAPEAKPAPDAPKPPKPDAKDGEKPAPAGAEPTQAPKALAPEGAQAPAPDSAKQAPTLDSAKPAPGAAPADAPAPAPGAAAPGTAAPDAKRGQVQGGAERRLAPPPTSDADAQARLGNAPPAPKLAPTAADQGQRRDGRPRYDAPNDAQVEGRVQGRDILNILGEMIVRGGDSDRFNRDGARSYYDEMPRGRTREVIERPNGVRIVTIRNRYGDVIQRSRIDRRDREVVLFYAPELENRPDREQVFRDPSLDLPPMQLDIPVDEYIIDTSRARNPDYYDFLREPPVERVERVYSLDEVRYSARVRDKMRRIDLDTIHFPTGSAEVSMNEATSLKKVAAAMKRIIDRNPGETFLIEGHTDAVGSDQSNLVLSDRRAESVAITLSDLFGIPPENLVTQGYGERFLKVRTDGPSEENRRVTIRRITPLVRPVASR